MSLLSHSCMVKFLHIYCCKSFIWIFFFFTLKGGENINSERLSSFGDVRGEIGSRSREKKLLIVGRYIWRWCLRRDPAIVRSCEASLCTAAGMCSAKKTAILIQNSSKHYYYPQYKTSLNIFSKTCHALQFG